MSVILDFYFSFKDIFLMLIVGLKIFWIFNIFVFYLRIFFCQDILFFSNFIKFCIFSFLFYLIILLLKINLISLRFALFFVAFLS